MSISCAVYVQSPTAATLVNDLAEDMNQTEAPSFVARGCDARAAWRHQTFQNLGDHEE